jgi:RimJ/RimL family protein N-acetyltransferase
VTEATKAIVDWAFLFTDLNRVFARHATTNPASGRVMQKIGMSFEGVLRQDARKGDRYIDHAIYGLLRQDWLKQHQQNQISLETDRYDRS